MRFTFDSYSETPCIMKNMPQNTQKVISLNLINYFSMFDPNQVKFSISHQSHICKQKKIGC